ncbi:11306_t:CDS:2 [Diversispora eburnea]|uniref:11306_t:CDS:1 n=1 Tax=Diversispora eburnea TaxID=1213867 RepID=A0A9N8WAD0_9GLOM|nr:11306_t:CDS:2 [Diversispora eburnea]
MSKKKYFKLTANAKWHNTIYRKYYQAFKLYDNKGDEHIPVEALGDLLRALDQNPTQEEVNQLMKSSGSKIDFKKFLEILGRPGGFSPAGTYEEFIEGFQVFDKDRTGYISASELRYVLTNLGEKLSDAEVDELMSTIDIDENGNLKYEVRINYLFP